MQAMLVGWVMLLACLAGAAGADEASAVKAVEKLGGKVTRDDELTGKPVIEVNLAFAHVKDADLKELKHLKQLATLALYNSQVTDEGLKELKDLKQLSTLYLNNTRVTDAGLKELKHLERLSTLALNNTGVTDAGLKELKDLKQLSTLDLYGTVKGAGLKELKDLKKLTSLTLGGGRVTDAAMKYCRAGSCLPNRFNAPAYGCVQDLRNSALIVVALVNSNRQAGACPTCLRFGGGFSLQTEGWHGSKDFTHGQVRWLKNPSQHTDRWCHTVPSPVGKINPYRASFAESRNARGIGVGGRELPGGLKPRRRASTCLLPQR